MSNSIHFIVGKAILQYYFQDSFSDEIESSSQLANSCMKDRSLYEENMGLYTDNTDVVKLAVLQNDNGVLARTICWLTNKGWRYFNIVDGGASYRNELRELLNELDIKKGNDKCYVVLQYGEYSLYPYVDGIQDLYYINGRWILASSSKPIEDEYVEPFPLDCLSHTSFKSCFIVCSISNTAYNEKYIRDVAGTKCHVRYTVEQDNVVMFRTPLKSIMGCYYNTHNMAYLECENCTVNKDMIITDIHGVKQHVSQCYKLHDGSYARKDSKHIRYSSVLSAWLSSWVKTAFGYMPKQTTHEQSISISIR